MCGTVGRGGGGEDCGGRWCSKPGWWCGAGWMGLDIGPDAIKQFQEALSDAKVSVAGRVGMSCGVW